MGLLFLLPATAKSWAAQIGCQLSASWTNGPFATPYLSFPKASSSSSQPFFATPYGFELVRQRPFPKIGTTVEQQTTPPV
jgi:hypothetical protein